MTRINSAIPVKCLTDEHLLAEHREIKRLPFCLQQAIKSGSINNIPKKFTLGRGHVLFFLDKMEFIYFRYVRIFLELRGRGFKVESYINNWFDGTCGKDCYCHYYMPTKEEHDLLVERITERITNSPKSGFHYYGKRISKKEAINLLNSI